MKYSAAVAAVLALALAQISRADARDPPAPAPGGSTGTRMALVPAGCFLMGAEEGGYCAERPAHQVCLGSFEIDVAEVENAAYGRCISAGACRNTGWPTDGLLAGPNDPVTLVSFGDAVAYCAFLGKRLPTEAEWERAGRGGDGRLYPFGDEEPGCEDINHGAWPARFFRCSAEYWCAHAKVCRRENPGRVEAVGSRPRDRSPFGVVDLSGNVFEWTADYFDPDYYLASPVVNPRGPALGSARSVRGGSFSSTRWSVRLTSRQPLPEETRLPNLGFRCARTVREDAPRPVLSTRIRGSGCRLTPLLSTATLPRR